jgi:hypothetical protein
VSASASGPFVYKGAIVTLDTTTGGAQPNVIAFQYNPERLRRTLQPQTAGGDQGNRSLAVIFTAAPVELFDLEIEIDATDQMAQGDDTGIYPQLAALELLVYPQSSDVVQQTNMLASGTIEVGPFVAPLTLLLWGQQRVVPVRVMSMTITEEAFGGYLNPIRATVALQLRALSYADLLPDTQGYNLFMQYQQVKEQIAQVAHTLTGTGVTNSQI